MSLGKKYKQLFEGKVRSNDSKLLSEQMIMSDEAYDEFLELILKYVKDPDDAEAELDRFDDGGFDSMSNMVTSNLERDSKFKAWKRKYGIKDHMKEDDANTTGEFDYDYFIKQFDSVQEVIEETEYELLQTLDGLAEDEDVYGLVSDKAEQAANQIRRYINGAYKQIEGIQNLLNRHKRNKDLDQ